MSRSVTIAVAYIMSVTTLNNDEALGVIRVGRSVAQPNHGFMKQLADFERSRLSEACTSLIIYLLYDQQYNIKELSRSVSFREDITFVDQKSGLFGHSF